MSDLPLGWANAVIGDTGQYINGLAFKPSDWGDKGTPIIRIKNLTTPNAPINRTTRQVPESVKVAKGTILVSWSATLDAFIWDREDAVLNQHIFKVVPDTNIADKGFLFYLLRSEILVMSAGDHLHGSTMKHINRGPFLAHQIPLPPLAEQKRIADKLEAVLGRVDACRARLDRVPALLKRFRQSVLTAATSGSLTEDWRFENGVGATWVNETVGSVITKIEAGLNVLCDERPPREDERGLVKISAVTWGTYDDEKSKTLPVHIQVPESTRISVGDFLISRANTLELVGACVIVHEVTRPVFLSDKILRLVLPDVLKPWLLYVLQSPNGRKQIEELSSGNQLSMRNLAQGNLRRITVPFPADDERKEIIRRVEALFAFADRIEARLATAQKTVERLTPATLAKAFRGELVPQDPNDEPAAVLLERLKGAPGKADAKPGQKRKAKAAH